MKNLMTRIAISLGAATLGAATLTPVVALSQQVAGYTIQEVCSNPDLAPLSQKLWDYVSKQDKLEIYIAYLEACGSSALTEEFAAQARKVVIRRTANYLNLPTDTYAFSKVGDRRINAYYVG